MCGKTWATPTGPNSTTVPLLNSTWSDANKWHKTKKAAGRQPTAKKKNRHAKPPAAKTTATYATTTKWPYSTILVTNPTKSRPPTPCGDAFKTATSSSIWKGYWDQLLPQRQAGATSPLFSS